MTLPKTKNQNYGHLATHGVFWNVAMSGANKFITLGGQVVLALLLVPTDMGLANMAIAMSSMVMFFGAGSVGDVLVQRGNYKKEAASGFWISVFLSLVTSILVLIMAMVALAIHRFDVAKLILVLSLLPLADCLTPIVTAFLKVRLDFKQLALCNFTSGITYTFSSVFLAWLGLGPYALVWSAIPRAMAFWLVALKKWQAPKLGKPDFKAMQKILKPSLLMSLIGFLVGLQVQMPIFILGILSSPESVGKFSWGWLVASQAIFLLAINLRQVLMPIFKKMGTDENRQRRAIYDSVMVITCFLALACGMQILMAESILYNFFPEKWHQSGPVITGISYGLALQGVQVCVFSWLGANGRYKGFLFAVLTLILFCSLFTTCGYFFAGIEGAAYWNSIGYAVGIMVVVFFNSFFNSTSQIFRFVLTVGVLFVICFELRKFESSHSSPWTAVLCSLIFLILASLFCIFTNRELFSKIFLIIKSKLFQTGEMATNDVSRFKYKI